MEQLKLPAMLMEQALHTWIWGIFWHSSLRILTNSVPAVSGAARSLGQVSHFPLSWAVSLCQLTNSHPDWSWPHTIRSSEFRPWCPVLLPEAAVLTPLFQLHLWVCNWNHRVWTGSQVHAATNRTTCDLTKGARLGHYCGSADSSHDWEGKTETTQTPNHPKRKQPWWGAASTLLPQRAS